MRIWVLRSVRIFGDAGHASSTMHIASGTQVRPFDLTPQILKKRSRRSEGGQIVQELNSVREESTATMPKEDGWIPSWFERRVKRRCSTTKKHAVYEKVPTS